MSLDRSTLSDDVRIDLLQDARTACRRERRELEDERAAFGRFLERLRELETVEPRRVDAATRTVYPGRGLERVRDAYAETVMSVPHYVERGDESFEAHVAGELGDELAAAVTRGTALHPRLKRSLVEATRTAVDARETILERIDAERANLERAEPILETLVDELVSIANQPLDRVEFNALRLARVRLLELRDRCDDLAARRQEFVRRRRGTPLVDGEAFYSYLYGECEWTFPLLSTLARVGELIEQVLRRVERYLSSAT